MQHYILHIFIAVLLALGGWLYWGDEPYTVVAPIEQQFDNRPFTDQMSEEKTDFSPSKQVQEPDIVTDEGKVLQEVKNPIILQKDISPDEWRASFPEITEEDLPNIDIP